MFLDVIARYRETLPPDHFNMGVAQAKLGHVLLKQNRLTEAEPHSLEACRILSKQTDPSNAFLVSARNDLAAIYRKHGQS